MIVPRYYEDLHFLHDNTMPNRSYYVPASCRMDTLVDARQDSDRFQLLSGDWKFRYYKSIHDLKDEFFAHGYDVSGYDTLPVPSVWQMHGYDLNHYINSRFPFPVDPPYVPQDNPCGAYVHHFEYHKDAAAPNAFLNFEGVDSCFFVWLNGRYVGYSQVSHSTSEFDVTDRLVDGDNTLAVLVLKWCDGSYLECQDKFRWNGIFRDVYLLKRPEQMVYDYFINTQIKSGTADINVRVKTVPAEVPVKVSLFDKDNNLLCEGVTSVTDEFAEYDQSVLLTVKDPLLWNAEDPNLYTVVLETSGETVVDTVGIRNVYTKDSVVYINDVPVKFYGVNRHESNPNTGYVVSMEQMKQELQMLKAHNFNAIRTSHYPCHPVFYQLCDRYGFYVIDEADVEAHGAEYLFHETMSFSRELWNVLAADNPEFIGAILDRVQRLVYRDKNRPCAVIWSMGNESAYGCGFELSLRWTKTFDPSRLTHYESARYVNTDRKYDYSNLDLHSRMYASLEEMQEYIDKNPDKPFIQCEYSHAMGNGPGDFEDYFRMFHSDPRFCGGFVWEFCDHAVYKGVADNGKAMYFYGGDHNEVHHDGNFCMDGLVYPDRRPHTGMLEFKNVHRPARATYDQEAGVVTLHSQLDFTNLQNYLNVRYEVSCDGVTVEAGNIGSPSVEPRGQAQIPLKISVPAKGKCYLRLLYSRKEASALLDAGHELGFDEIKLENKDGRVAEAVSLAAACMKGRLRTSEDDTWITVKGDFFTYVYNKRTGMWHSLEVNGKALIEKPMELNIWRAPTDNDRKVKKHWFRARYNQSWSRAYDSKVIEERGTVRIENTMCMGGYTIQPLLDMETVWTVNAAGQIGLTMEVSKNKIAPMLPRFGIRMFLPKSMDQVTYYGLGPFESYADKRRASYHGRFSCSVDELHEDYIRPQENGSHCDCEFVTVNGGNMSFSAVSDQPFSFNASVYTQEELETKGHNFELQPSGYTVLCLDYAQNGIGSNSCGPVLADQYALNAENFTFTMHLIPKK